MTPNEVFFSHSSMDKDRAKPIVNLLRSHGIPVWYSEYSIRGSQQWHDEIGKALARCDWFIVLLTQNVVNSMWVKRETLYALRQERLNERISPILLEACNYEEISWVLPSIQFIDYTANDDNAKRALLQTWGVPLQS